MKSYPHQRADARRAEVLMILPSPEEILRKAEEAKAKAAAAPAANKGNAM